MTTEQVANVFGHLIALRPECAEGFARLRDGLLEDYTMFGGPVGNNRPAATKAELVEVQKAAQNYCDRMCSVIRGLAFVAGHDFPELGDRFHRIAQAAASVLEDYKTQLCLMPVPTDEDNERKPISGTDDTVVIGAEVPAFKARRVPRLAVAALAEEERAKMERALTENQ